MKKYIVILQIFSAAGLLVLCGCDGSSPKGKSPSERNALVIRMFRSLEKGDASSAAAQAAKVRALDPGNAYFNWIIEVQECNQAVAAAQKALDAGQLAEAARILQEVRKRYPLQSTIASELNKVRQLARVQAALKMYSSGRDLAARDQALKAAARQAGQLGDPALTALCNDLRRQLDAEIAKSVADSRTKPGNTASPDVKPKRNP